MKGSVEAVALIAALVVVLVCGFLIRTQAPCSWFAYASAAEAPARCLMRP